MTTEFLDLFPSKLSPRNPSSSSRSDEVEDSLWVTPKSDPRTSAYSRTRRGLLLSSHNRLCAEPGGSHSALKTSIAAPSCKPIHDALRNRGVELEPGFWRSLTLSASTSFLGDISKPESTSWADEVASPATEIPPQSIDTNGKKPETTPAADNQVDGATEPFGGSELQEPDYARAGD